MTETYSKSRQQAEIAFGKVQKEFFSKNNTMEEIESEAQLREAKTLRLREARLAKEEGERLSKAAGSFLSEGSRDSSPTGYRPGGSAK